jgi:hypothetical protein
MDKSRNRPSDDSAIGGVTQLEQPLLGHRLDSVVIGSLVGFAADGAPLVDFPGNPRDNPVPARTTARLTGDDVGCEVVLLFERADPAKPILVGSIIHPKARPPQRVFVERDEDRLELTADREIVLRCGNASITLTRAGKVLIRGAYVSSHSNGVNRIKGGVVLIN